MISKIIPRYNIKDISSDVLLSNGKVGLFPSKRWREFRWDDFRFFCHQKGRYGIPTHELCLLVISIINWRDTIEIGAGAGDFGHHLRIHMTDSKQQEMPEVIAAYKAMKQPTIIYPNNVEKLDAVDAIIKYEPKVVFASWITPYSPRETYYASNPFGVKVNKVVDLVDTFIMYGNIDVHGDSPIMKLPHEEIYEDWMISRAKNQENNRLWIWNRK